LGICRDGRKRSGAGPCICVRFCCGAIMIQCKDCELYEVDENGRRTFKCDPFTNVKEPECLAKWQLIRLDMLVASYQGMMGWYRKLAPLQYMEKEIEDIDESERWKIEDEDNEPEEEF